MELPNEISGTVYDRLVVIYLKENPAVTHIPTSWTSPKGQKLSEILSFDPTICLSNPSRLKVFKYQDGDDIREFSIFARIEQGMELTRIQAICKTLNKELHGKYEIGTRLAIKTSLVNNYAEKALVAYDYPKKMANGKFVFSTWKGPSTRSKSLKRLPVTGGEEDDDGNSSSSEFQNTPKKSRMSVEKAVPTTATTSRVKTRSTKVASTFRKSPVKSSKKGKGQGKKSAANPKDKPSAKNVVLPNPAYQQVQAEESQTAEAATSQLTDELPADVVDLVESSSSDNAAGENVEETVTLEVPVIERALSGNNTATAFEDMSAVEKSITLEKVKQKIANLETEAMFKRVLSDFFDSKVKPALDGIQNEWKTFLTQYEKDIAELKERPKGRERTLAVCKKIEEKVDAFTKATGQIKLDFEKATNASTSMQARAIGIISRPLPWDLMGLGMDVFFANLLVQDLLVYVIIPFFNGVVSEYDYYIAKSVTKKMFTPCAMAHLVHKHATNLDKVAFYRRTIPQSLMRMLEFKLVPRLRNIRRIGEQEVFENMSIVKDKLSTAMTNARTSFYRRAFRKTDSVDSAVQALYDMSMEMYSANSHDLDQRVKPDSLEEFTAKLKTRKEYRNAQRQAEKGNDGNESESDANEIAEEGKVFHPIRGPHPGKIWTVHDIIKIIIAAGHTLGKNVYELQYEDVPALPNLATLHKEVCDEYVNRLDDLLNEFTGVAGGGTPLQATPHHATPSYGSGPSPRPYVPSPRKFPCEYVTGYRKGQQHEEIDHATDDESNGGDVSNQTTSVSGSSSASVSLLEKAVIGGSTETSESATPDVQPPPAKTRNITIEELLMNTAGPSCGVLADLITPEAIHEAMLLEEQQAKLAEEARQLKEYDSIKKSVEQRRQELEEELKKLKEKQASLDEEQANRNNN